MEASLKLQAIFCWILLLLLRKTASTKDKHFDALYYNDNENVNVKIVAIMGLQESVQGKCSSLSGFDIQHAVALRWVVSMVNADESGNTTKHPLIPGVKLGVEIFNDCSLVHNAAFYAGLLLSNIQSNNAKWAMQTNASVPILGVIGTSRSVTTTVVADIVRDSYVPLVGISATLPELSDKSNYPAFVRMVPSDKEQAKMVIAMAKKYQWSFIMGIHSSDNYGTNGMEEVKKLALQERICVFMEKKLDEQFFSSDSAMEDLVRETIFSQLDRTNGTLGIVYYGGHAELLILFDFIKKRQSGWNNGQSKLNRVHWIMTEGVAPTHDLAYILEDYKNKVMVLGPAYMAIESFKAYFFSVLSSPPDWFDDAWKSMLQTHLEESYSCTGFSFTSSELTRCDLKNKMDFSNYLPFALDAAYILVKALKDVHSTKCTSPVMCQGLADVLNNGYLHYGKTNQSFTYASIGQPYVPMEFIQTNRTLVQANGDLMVPGQPLYAVNVFKDNKFVEMGTYSRTGLSVPPFDLQTSVPSSQCKKECTECYGIGKESYVFKSGEVLLLGVFSLHWSSKDIMFQCGDYREDSLSYIASEAFINAIERLRKDTGRNFGYLIIDDCYSPLKATEMIVKVLSKALTIRDPDTDVIFDPSLVTVVIGAQSSPSTMAMLPVLTKFGIPMISYSSTNPNLDNRVIYPYFCRTVSSDSVQAVAIMRILKHMKVTHVGAIIIDNSYGKELYRLFRVAAEEEKICVEDAFAVTAATEKKVIADKLKGYHSKLIKVIVAFVMDSIAIHVLEAVTTNQRFTFVSSEAWGPNLNIISHGFGSNALGSLVLGAATPNDFDNKMKDHLRSLNGLSPDCSSWLRQFWQDQFKCNLVGDFKVSHKVTCTKANSQKFSDATLKEFEQAPFSNHTTLATLSAGLAVHERLEEEQSLPLDPVKLTMAIRKVRLRAVDGMAFRPFLDSGNGNAGFVIYNVQKSSGNTITYEKVGTVQGDTSVNINSKSTKFYDQWGVEEDTVFSSCKHKAFCLLICDDPTAISTPGPAIDETDNTDDSTSGVTIGLVFMSIVLVMVVVVCAVCMVLTWKGKNTCLKNAGYVKSSRILKWNNMEQRQPPPLPPPRPKDEDGRRHYTDASEVFDSSSQDTTSGGGLSTVAATSTGKMSIRSEESAAINYNPSARRPSQPSTQPMPHQKVVFSPASSDGGVSFLQHQQQGARQVYIPSSNNILSISSESSSSYNPYVTPMQPFTSSSLPITYKVKSPQFEAAEAPADGADYLKLLNIASDIDLNPPNNMIEESDGSTTIATVCQGVPMAPLYFHPGNPQFVSGQISPNSFQGQGGAHPLVGQHQMGPPVNVIKPSSQYPHAMSGGGRVAVLYPHSDNNPPQHRPTMNSAFPKYAQDDLDPYLHTLDQPQPQLQHHQQQHPQYYQQQQQQHPHFPPVATSNIGPQFVSTNNLVHADGVLPASALLSNSHHQQEVPVNTNAHARAQPSSMATAFPPPMPHKPMRTARGDYLTPTDPPNLIHDFKMEGSDDEGVEDSFPITNAEHHNTDATAPMTAPSTAPMTAPMTAPSTAPTTAPTTATKSEETVDPSKGASEVEESATPIPNNKQPSYPPSSSSNELSPLSMPGKISPQPSSDDDTETTTPFSSMSNTESTGFIPHTSYTDQGQPPSASAPNTTLGNDDHLASTESSGGQDTTEASVGKTNSEISASPSPSTPVVNARRKKKRVTTPDRHIVFSNIPEIDGDDPGTV